jgi:hypothetical protein
MQMRLVLAVAQPSDSFILGRYIGVGEGTQSASAGSAACCEQECIMVAEQISDVQMSAQFSEVDYYWLLKPELFATRTSEQ